jgi:signal transduction histidine kinase
MRLATASHDIRQPIGALKSTVATFAKDQPKEVSDQLNAALDYLDQLAESYVDQEENDAEQGDALTRSDAKEIVASDMICATLDRMFRKEAEQKDLVFEASAEPSNLKTDPLAVMRILSNLLSNAIKHTPQGQITLRGERDESDYVFSVHNSTNLPEHIDKEKMFHPYEKGDHSTGSGLGLSIVDSLSSRAGMRLSWASPAGRGTTFDLIVPLE